MSKNVSEELYEHHCFEAEKKHDLIRVDKFLLLRLSNTTRNKIQKNINNGNVFCNNKIIKSNYKVKPYDKISIRFEYEPYDKEIIPEDIPLDIIYEDTDLIVLNKPPNMVVHPSYGHYSGTLVHALLFKYMDIANSGEKERPGLVHRLDKNTTGLMVVARNNNTLSQLSAQFADRSISRQYTALVWGDLKQDKGTIVGHVGRHKKNRKLMTVLESEDERGKHAVTHYEVIERFRYVTLVSCVLETGRTHQIRVHMKHLGHPLFNDDEYGGDKVLRGTTFTKYKQFVHNCFKILPRQALHAIKLSFIHPSKQTIVQFDSSLPDDMKFVIERWRNYIKNQVI
tara:strand:- start:996 stop:2015 length:1020 start_codon:yes stop_codon:yes gene_type:complete